MKKFCLGFTLIELMVVAAMVGVLTTIGVASYNTFNDQRIVRRAADEVKTYLRVAASKAKNGEKDCSACLCTTSNYPLDGWYIDFTNKRIYGTCNAGATHPLFGEVFFLPGLPSDVGTISCTVCSLLFKPINLGTSLSSEVTITVTRGTNLVNLKIDPSGQVKE